MLHAKEIFTDEPPSDGQDGVKEPFNEILPSVPETKFRQRRVSSRNEREVGVRRRMLELGHESRSIQDFRRQVSLAEVGVDESVE